MTALARLCKRKNVRLKLRAGEARGSHGWTGWQPDGVQDWRCTLLYAGRQFTFDWFAGSMSGAPRVADAIANLLSDAALGENSYEDFLSIFGYHDEERHSTTHRLMERIADGMDRLLGNDIDDFQAAMNDW